MNTLELKKLFVQRFAEINDVSFLEAIKATLDSKKRGQGYFACCCVNPDDKK